eukprot:1604721-Amphidinium_carterae.1
MAEKLSTDFCTDFTAALGKHAALERPGLCTFCSRFDGDHRILELRLIVWSGGECPVWPLRCFGCLKDECTQ